MPRSRCAAHCHCSDHASSVSRRAFLGASAFAIGAGLASRGALAAGELPGPLVLNGPAAKYVPTVKACFVRRKGEYGLRWPGAVYDGEAARAMYTDKLREAAAAAKLTLDLRPEPIYSAAEADAWIAEAQANKPDGLMVVLLDRQEHSWPTAEKAAASGIPTVVYSPIGTAFTVNTAPLASKLGVVVYSTDDFSQAAYGLKMLAAGAKLRQTRYLVIKGGQRQEGELADLGIKLRVLPAKDFLELYQATAVTEPIIALAEDYLRRAQRVQDATRDDVINGVRAYFVARQLLEREEADGITMDCLGVLGPVKESLPCLAWSRLNDERVPAACEADLGAAAAITMVHYLFDRPGFQQDPVPETARKAIIGAHCSCPTKLAGYDEPSEPFIVRHHHANRDATTQTLWRKGHDVTSLDVLPAGGEQKRSQLLIAAGRVLENVNVPPAGGCVSSVMVEFDGPTEVLAWPGFHQIFFYGNYRQQLIDFCQLYGLEAMVV